MKKIMFLFAICGAFFLLNSNANAQASKKQITQERTFKVTEAAKIPIEQTKSYLGPTIQPKKLKSNQSKTANKTQLKRVGNIQENSGIDSKKIVNPPSIGSSNTKAIKKAVITQSNQLKNTQKTSGIASKKIVSPKIIASPTSKKAKKAVKH